MSVLLPPPAGTALLVPVKINSNSKTRLSGLLSPEERQALARAMLRAVLSRLAGAYGGLPGVGLAAVGLADGGLAAAGRDGEALNEARGFGFEIIPEAEQISESRSVDRACSRLAGQGWRGVLRLPLDLPLFHPVALNPLWEAVQAAPGNIAVLVPSRDGTGTNALYRSPPTAFASRFGPDSLRLHLEEARRTGVEATVLSLPELGLDIDTPEDVAELLGRDEAGENSGGAIRELLLAWGVAERL